MAKDKKEYCHNCHWYSRMWNFCGNPKSTACRKAEWVGAYDWCIYWEEREKQWLS